MGKEGEIQGQSWEEKGGDDIERMVVSGCSGWSHFSHLHAHTHTHTCMSFTFPKIRGIDEEADSDKGYDEGVKEEAWKRIRSMNPILLKMTSDLRGGQRGPDHFLVTQFE